MAAPSLADIERQYDEALKRAKGRSDLEAEIRVERAQALADIRLREVAERERALWLREALAAFPLAAEFPDRVVGETEDRLRESAKALHEKLRVAFERHARQQRVNEIVKAQLEGGDQNGKAQDSNDDGRQPPPD